MPRRPKNMSDKDLEEIEMLASLGLTQEQIADIKGVCADTLRKYAHKPWKRGKSKGIGKVAQTAFEMAVSGKHPAMTIFFLKTQGQWKENPFLPEELLKLMNQQGA